MWPEWPEGTFQMSAPEELLCSRSWRLRHSSWMLWGILSAGILWPVGFGYVSIKTKDRILGAIAVGWTLAVVGFLVATSTIVDMPEKGEQGDGGSNLVSTLMALAYVAGIGVAIAWRRRWLVWRAHNNRPWYAQPDAETDDPVQPATDTSAHVGDAMNDALASAGSAPESTRDAAGEPSESAPAPAPPPPSSVDDTKSAETAPSGRRLDF